VNAPPTQRQPTCPDAFGSPAYLYLAALTLAGLLALFLSADYGDEAASTSSMNEAIA
jgi:hypothetical protein